eukprot:CAMPEP_0182603026 /NCGR_PEP_ID=MMETSP1324-20130603/92284_1 /TAXON_ID=236786 /ORGANISM="Florenciella sp., Strain RCC1587" /LENGTH=165 /DNA_ID=CAMNT_0024820953 /DNA_START=1648 /DNA_END=2144 /DNA_ORIENTATION=+
MIAAPSGNGSTQASAEHREDERRRVEHHAHEFMVFENREEGVHRLMLHRELMQPVAVSVERRCPKPNPLQRAEERDFFLLRFDVTYRHQLAEDESLQKEDEEADVQVASPHEKVEKYDQQTAHDRADENFLAFPSFLAVTAADCAFDAVVVNPPRLSELGRVSDV